MPTIEGRILAKMMQRLGEKVLRDFDGVEFDDGISEEPLQLLSVSQDAIEVRTKAGRPKALSRAVASKGTIVDPAGILVNAVTTSLGETFCQRAARLLGDPSLELSILAGLPRHLREIIDRLVVLPDHAVATIGRLALEQDLSKEEIQKTSEIANKLELYGVTSALAMTTTDFLLHFGGDALDDYIAFEANRFWEYDNPNAPFIWPNSLGLDKTKLALAAKSVPGLSKGLYFYSLPEPERRQRLRYLFEEAPDADFDGTPARSCGRLRQLALALIWLWDTAGRQNSSLADIWRADLYWLKESFYMPGCQKS